MENKNELINKELDFWKEGSLFAEKILNPEAKQMFIDYCKEKKFNNNEITYFRFMVVSALEFPIIMGTLLSKFNEQESNIKQE